MARGIVASCSLKIQAALTNKLDSICEVSHEMHPQIVVPDPERVQSGSSAHQAGSGKLDGQHLRGTKKELDTLDKL